MSRHRCTQSWQDAPQPFMLVWLDAMVKESEQNHEAQERLQKSFTIVKVFESIQPCEDYIRTLTSTARLVFIVVGHLGQEFVAKVHNIGQIKSIYIYCIDRAKHEDWWKNFVKVIMI